MSTIIAALDTTAAARPVLETALRISETSGDAVEAVHVADGPRDTPLSLAERAGIAMRVLSGRVDVALLDVLREQQTSALVLGARATTGGRRPVGHIAMGLLERADKPLVLVPPEAVAPRRPRIILVPLAGEESSSVATMEALVPMFGTQVEFVVLHVFTEATLPRMLDRPLRDMRVLSEEFAAQHLPHATEVEMCTGPVGTKVIEASSAHDADMIVMSWSPDTEGGHILREVLASSKVPVVVLPLPTEPSHEAPSSDPTPRRTVMLLGA